MSRGRAAASLLVAASSLLAACGDGPTAAPRTGAGPASGTTQPAAPAPEPPQQEPSPPASPWVAFADITAGSGLESFVLHAGRETSKNWILETIGGGICAADFDGDGDIDLWLIDGDDIGADGEVAHFDGAGPRLYRNDGGFRFTDVTAASGAGLRGYFLAGAAADYDGDGDVDVCIAGYDALHLLRNRGDGTFEDVTAAAGIVPRRWDVSAGCAWADLDGDGRLDLYVANYVDQRRVVEETRAQFGGVAKHCKWRGHDVFCGPRGLAPQTNRLFLQRSDGTFTDASLTHLDEPPRVSFQPVFTDLDGDGDLDGYIANDAVENTLLVNDGKGRMTDRGVETGAAAGRGFVPQGSMGVAVADFDLDGRFDIAVSNFSGEYDALYRNATRSGGPLLFEDVAVATGFGRADQPTTNWGIGLVDFDSDGLLDAFVAAGHIYDDDVPSAGDPSRQRQRNRALRGVLAGRAASPRAGAPAPRIAFEDVSAMSGPHFQDARIWRGAVFPDLDDDGDADVVVVAQHAAPVVLRNDGGERNAWLRVDLRPAQGRPTPAGARVTVTLPDGTKRVAELHCGSSYASSDDPRLLLGCGSADVLPRVEVGWPGGGTTVLENVRTRQTIVVKQDP